ncbi:MAG: hypothetical protein JW754_01980 [Candidatus Aenigmarchaeota archaeon]|nr:hypothetical protein [Candidatus Aenigmarchaeota archaeon]
MGRDHEMPDPEKIAEVLKVVRKEIPGLIREIVDILYSENSARNMGKAVGIYYKTLQQNGIPKEMALEMTKGYVINIAKMFDGKSWGKHFHDHD